MEGRLASEDAALALAGAAGKVLPGMGWDRLRQILAPHDSHLQDSRQSRWLG